MTNLDHLTLLDILIRQSDEISSKIGNSFNARAIITLASSITMETAITYDTRVSILMKIVQIDNRVHFLLPQFILGFYGGLFYANSILRYLETHVLVWIR